MNNNEFSISVCIPVFNQDVSTLIRELTHQIPTSGGQVKIILVDDASEEGFKNINTTLKLQPFVHYEEVQRNMGRSSIRNYLGSLSDDTHLLFIDGDSIIDNPRFIANYITALKINPEDVYCGGTHYQETKPEADKMLHWKYGTKVIAVKHSQEGRDGQVYFMSSNFLIKKELFDKIKFDEEVISYGHEDTAFGFELKKMNKKVQGYNNPVLHGDLDTNEEFLRKVEHSVLNLKRLEKNSSIEEHLSGIRLVKRGKSIKDHGLSGIYKFLFSMLRRPVLNNLHGAHPSLIALNFYKLYLYLK